jgi:hypothetical protein
MSMATSDEARCPIRIGDACSLCHPGASGPQTCGLVYLVMCDPDLREELLRRWDCFNAAQAAPSLEPPQARPLTR